MRPSFASAYTDPSNRPLQSVGRVRGGDITRRRVEDSLHAGIPHHDSADCAARGSEAANSLLVFHSSWSSAGLDKQQAAPCCSQIPN